MAASFAACQITDICESRPSPVCGVLFFRYGVTPTANKL
ncbi:hypothetical protein D8I24_4029 (plasmid) [Cupriavidus necator H850]|nr:hypothetical protein D8I24_4029 [Cupriavidus necator H850]